MANHKGWYTPEFKAEAVRLATSGDRSVTRTAKDLGVALESLRKWVREAAIEDGQHPGALTADEREELRRLRREVRVLQEEREILQKAAAFFAKETEPRR